MSELMWVAVPGGTILRGEESDAVLRVLITPKLKGNSLASHGMENWPPQSLVNATLLVDLAEDINGELYTVEVKPPHIQAQPGVWEAFFGPNTIVTSPRKHDPNAPMVEVDSTSTKAETINHIFTTVAATDFRLDNYKEDQPILDEIIKKELINWVNEEQPVMALRPGEPSSNSPQNNRFTPPDFHRTIAILREHPAVLKALGLIIELRIPVSMLPTQFPEGIIRVRWTDVPAPLPPIISPWTKYNSMFLPGSTNNISAGLVTLTDDREETNEEGAPCWKVVTVDVDNGVKKLEAAARAISDKGDEEKTSVDTQTFMFPAMRTAGLMLLRCGRQADFEERRQAADINAQRNSMSEAVLTADDLVLGYRIDIKLQGRDWSSLHERDAKYTTASREGNEIVIGGGTVREEGHLKSHAAIRVENVLRSDEVVARWTGWSLSVPRPSFNSQADIKPLAHPDMPFKFDWKFSVPKGSLPLLRFTHTYRLRARVADIAGGGLALNNPDADRCFTKAVLYRRYEPVSPPDLLLPNELDQNTLSPGESINHLLIRSENDSNATESNTTRLLFAPKSSLTLAEQHNALEGMSVQQIVNLVKQAKEDANKFRSSNSDEVLLPDFAAGGVCVFPKEASLTRSESGDPEVIKTERSWSQPWPEFKPKEIVLRDRAPGETKILEWEPASHSEDQDISERLIVRLAKAEEITLDLSSFLKEDTLDHFEINESLSEISGITANEGRHPMVTPARTVTFTHAVRRPLSYPNGTLVVDRSEGMNYALLILDPRNHGIDPKSTVKLEITASWKEQNDNMTQEVVDYPVNVLNIDREDYYISDEIRHEFGDTKHRIVTYTLTAVSRFQQFFEEDNEEAFVARTVQSPISIPSSARPSPPMVVSTCPAFVWEENHEDGEDFSLNRRRKGGYLRIELKGSWNETGEGEQLAVLVWKDNNPPKEIEPFVTQAGRDPIYDAPYYGTTGPERWPKAADFTLASRESREVYLKEAGTNVLAVPHEPWNQDGRWFVDIAIPSLVENSYCPFVRLALARYQPNSLEGLEISSVVMTEMVQLLPERSLRVRRGPSTNSNGKSLFVSFSGPYLQAFDITLEQFKSPPGIDSNMVDLTYVNIANNNEGPNLEIPTWVQVNYQLGNWGMCGYENCPDKEILLDLGHTGKLRLRIQEKERGEVMGLEGYKYDAIGARTVYSDIVDLPENTLQEKKFLKIFHGGNGTTTNNNGLPLQGIFYGVMKNGDLIWNKYVGHGEEVGSTENTQSWDVNTGNPIGRGFNHMLHIFGCGDGVIMAIHPNGNLHWYCYNGNGESDVTGTLGWHPNSGNVIGSGWKNYRQIFVVPREGPSNDSAQLQIFAVAQNGDLHWYSYNGNGEQDPSGTQGWHQNSGNPIGNGWQNFKHIHGSGNVIFAVHEDGNLHWYSYSGNGKEDVSGTEGWNPNSGNRIGRGWQNMQHVFGGVSDDGGLGHMVMAVNLTGDLIWYRYTGQGESDVSGALGWDPTSGKYIGNSW
ncbi:hypothetical protein GCM10009865_38550 [Aeromicrobium ponti]|uniref:Uncharacterized protein n=1 Tax=Cytobacillus oceanisediminis TaxID=665099 RepID=A0A562JIX8_9BACI|nr:tachylectin-related carbohydrate-binding protein [Cytobacillus oceanisediminis]TWH83142.1 hypothetical protein IQ19_03877 [Cytobacillus oceanisediminis]